MRRITSLFSPTGLPKAETQNGIRPAAMDRLNERRTDSPVANEEMAEGLGVVPLKTALLRGKKLRKIAAHLSNQSFDQALKAAKSHLISYPNDGFAWALIAEASRGQGQGESAVEAFQKSIAYDRENIRLKRIVGLEQASAGEHENAMSILEDVLHYVADDLVILALLRSYKETNLWSKAANLAQRVTEATINSDERIFSKTTAKEISGIFSLSVSKLYQMMLAEAETCLAEGRINDASEIYEEISRTYPDFPDALIIRIKFRLEEGDDKEARHLLQKALQACGGDWDDTLHLISTLLDADAQNLLIQACFRQEEIGHQAGKWVCRFYISHRNQILNNLDVSVPILARAYRSWPSAKAALLLFDIYSSNQWNSKVVIHYCDCMNFIDKIDEHRLSRMNEMYYRAADALWRDDIDRATLLVRDGFYDQAISFLNELIQGDKYYIDFYFVLGDALFAAGDLTRAEEAFSQGFALGDKFPRQQRRALIDKVSNAARDHVANHLLDPQNYAPTNYAWLADHYSQKHAWESAEYYLTKALEFEPDDRRIATKLIRVLGNLGKDIEALQLAYKLVADHPKDSAARRALGDIQMTFSMYRDAAANYKLAVDRDRSNPFYAARLAQAYFIEGEIKEALSLNEHRKQVPTFIAANKAYPFPEWNGEISSGKRLLVWHEHGFGVGQNILHSCFLNLVTELGIDVVLEVEGRLVPLYQRSFPQIEIIAGEQASYFDRTDIGYQTPIGSLARWFRTSIESFADYRPFFQPDADLSSATRTRLLSETGERHLVGISWTSTNPFVGDKKSIPLVALLKALDLPDVQLVNLQYGDHEDAVRDAVEKTGVSLISSGVDNTNDLDGLATVTDALDLVISIGHTTAHLAGALGKRNLVLLPSSPFIHWLARGDRCIWYANSTLIRRAPVDPDWSLALGETRRLAEEFFAKSHEGRPAEDESGESRLLSTNVAMSAFTLQNAIDGFSAQHAYGSAIELLKRKSAAYGWSRVDALQMIDLLTAVGRYMEADQMLVELPAADLQSADILRRQYRLALATYRLEDALRHNSGLIELGDEVDELMLERIVLLHKLGRTAEALETSRSLSLAYGPSVKWALLHSRLLNELGATKQAEATLAPFCTTAEQPEIEIALAKYAYKRGNELEGGRLLNRVAAGSGAASTVARFWRARIGAEAESRRVFSVPKMKGTFPENSEKDIVIFFAADNLYFWNYCQALITSLGTNCSNVFIHVHVINPDDFVQKSIDAFSKKFTGVSISYTHELFDVSEMTAGMAKTYFACSRFIRLPELMERSPSTYVCIDCDCLVRGDLSDINWLRQDVDIAAYRRFVPEEFLEVAAGGLIINPTPAAKQFLDSLCRDIVTVIEAGEASWFLDQVSLNETISQNEMKGLKVLQLGMDYIDWFFQPGSKIWTGKGNRKSDNSVYLEEFFKYKNLSCDVFSIGE